MPERRWSVLELCHVALARVAALGLLLLAAWSTQAVAADGASTRTEQVALTLEAGQPVATPDSMLWLALRFDLIPDWHIYWRNPGDSGEAPRVDWTLPTGWEAGEIQWPVPQRIPVGPLVNYGYEDSVSFLVPVRVPATAVPGADGARIDADVTWLVCKVECIPQDGRVSLQLPVGPPGPVQQDRFEPVRATWPVRLPGTAGYDVTPDGIVLHVSDSALSFEQAEEVWFAADAWGPIAPSGEQSWDATGERLTLTMTAGDMPLASGAALNGLLVVTDAGSGTPLTRGFTVTATPAAAASPSAPAVGLWVAIGFAVLGGLLLNLMPCVLPVLSIKALGLVQQAAADGGDSAHGARHGLAFGAGVLLTFVALAALLIGLRAGGAAIGWGFQLQEPVVVIGLMLLMLALGLNLSGVFSVGGNLAGIGQSLTERRDLRGSFATGVLAVVVASPCTAPFMGTALGFALTRPPVETLLVFGGLAAGFAAPLMLLSARPGWARLLPRPGPWMERLRNALAFPLYATAAWLLWVLTQQVDPTRLAAALAATVLFAFGLWWLGQPLRRRGTRHALVATLLVGSLGLVVYASRGEAPEVGITATERWSPQQVADLRADGRAVLVNFTAAWCITCKVNERVALDTDDVREALQTYGIAYLKGDWTNRDATITGELQRYGRSGVPLYLLYPAGPGAPEVLPQLLTEGLVLQAIERSVSKTHQGA